MPALLVPSQQQQRRSLTATPQLRGEDTLKSLHNRAIRGNAGQWGTDAFKKPASTSSVPFPPSSYNIPPPKPAPVKERPVDLNKPGPRVRTKLARLPRDDEIRAPYVFLQEKDADGNELQGMRESVPKILAKLDRKSESLQVVVDSNADDPNAPRWPVAVIVNKKEELARAQKEKERQNQSAAANKEKELELNWALAPHDVDHKLRTLQKFLVKGWKVQLLLLKKGGKGVKVASKKQAEELLEKLTETVAAVPGSKEWRGREGQILGSMRIFLQGKRQEEDAKEVFTTKKAQREAKKAAWEERQKANKVDEPPEEKPEEKHEEQKEEDIDYDDAIEIVSRRR